ncbi:DUF6348 family protein [Micromonospora sp. NPDC048843]|uniref:DUF6348 family protein n=1 Tax=Micromonospora sp. NPDC048843 TaxID=3155389 RepID=UPI00340F240F
MIDQRATPQPLPAERVLELAAPMLAEVGGQWLLTEGPMLRSGSLGVRVLPSDSDDYRHLDLEILLNVDRPDVPTVVDCTLGLAADPVEAARQAIQAWIETCLVTVLEMIEQKGRLANHFRSGDQGGFAGWHAIVGSATGWSVDGSQAKQEWFTEAMPWSTLAPVIAAGLDRPYLNGVRMLVGQGGDSTECEVRINGQRHEPSAAALAALDWPRTDRFGLARTFVLLVGPD